MSVTQGPRDQPVILIADDDAATRRVLRLELEREGYGVVEACDGPSAVATATSAAVDLALLDVGMPGVDGYEVLRRLRREPSMSATPVLFLSGRGLGSDAAKALGLGAHDYVRKPYDRDELLARVEAALRVRSLQETMERRSADLEQLNRTDPLTGLYNRRWLVEQMRSVSAEALRRAESYAVLMVDIDHFKAVNDGWGHEAGDRILCEVASRLQHSLRGPDIAARWGGEEFLILLPSTTLAESLIVAERVRAALAAPLPQGEVPLPPAMSASIGCASGDGLDFSSVVRRADAALYRAKASGRDRVEAADDVAPAAPADHPSSGGSVPDGAGPTPFDIDARVLAVLAVLAGRSAESVAAESGVEVELVRRWCHTFTEGGRDRLAGRPPPGSDEIRDRYLAVLGHELLIPLTVIKGWTSLMASHRLSPAQVDDLPAIILEAADRMERTGRDILDAAAVAMGRLHLVVGAMDVRAAVAEVCDAIGEHGVIVRPAIDTPALVVADRDRMIQVLTNLLVTARRHGGAGPIEVTLATTTSELSLQVTTRGHPLDFEVARRLFEPWPSDAVVTETGVGLYVCRALVVAHGGVMGVQGDEEVTTFWVRLPAGGPPAGELVERKTTP